MVLWSGIEYIKDPSLAKYISFLPVLEIFFKTSGVPQPSTTSNPVALMSVKVKHVLIPCWHVCWVMSGGVWVAGVTVENGAKVAG